MKKQLSSLDLHYLAKELKLLEDTRIDRIYQPEKSNIVLQLYKANEGKKILNIVVGESLFISASREESPEPLNFCMLLRKHLDGLWLKGVRQINSERIIELSFGSKTDAKKLYLEFFGKGNAVLCDNDGVIINSLEHHEFKERTIKPKIRYDYPKMKYNFLDLKIDDLTGLFENSKTESLVKCLAVELGLGGVYSEEVCILSDADKKINAKDINEKGIKKIHSMINKIVNNKIEAKIVLRDNEIIDANPFGLKYYDGCEFRDFESFSEALSFFYSHFKPKVKSEYGKRLEKLHRIMEEQTIAIGELRKEEEEARAKGELIYHNYQQITGIIADLSNAAKKYSWKEIKEKLKGHKVVKEVNDKERKAVVEV